ncbi:MAG: rhodanese-like domain-containing protein [Planctomycetia bacterium]|nr:rhodanese-like domain-containing protein [Planctomycetia bacterium]
MHLRFGMLAILLVAASAARLLAGEHTTDSLEKVKKQVADKKAVLVDVREQDEWDKGHCEGALLVPLSDLGKKGKGETFAKELEKKLPKDKVVYCHCARGRRALVAADALKQLGYDVRPLKPGYQELLDAGFKQAEK